MVWLLDVWNLSGSEELYRGMAYGGEGKLSPPSLLMLENLQRLKYSNIGDHERGGGGGTDEEHTVFAERARPEILKVSSEAASGAPGFLLLFTLHPPYR